jgi:hypothetical protein
MFWPNVEWATLANCAGLWVSDTHGPGRGRHVTAPNEASPMAHSNRWNVV